LLETKKKYCLETKNLIWQRLDQLGVVPGTSLYFQGVRIRKTRPLAGFDIACKWKRDYRGIKVKDTWFILTDLGSLPYVIAAYKQRMGIEQMFRDYKTGGYNIEGTSLKRERFLRINLLIALAYTSAIFQDNEIRKMQVQKYISRRKDKRNKYRRRSTFGIGLDEEKWVNYLEQYSEPVRIS
jgi:hypothetical protein